MKQYVWVDPIQISTCVRVCIRTVFPKDVPRKALPASPRATVGWWLNRMEESGDVDKVVQVDAVLLLLLLISMGVAMSLRTSPLLLQFPSESTIIVISLIKLAWSSCCLSQGSPFNACSSCFSTCSNTICVLSDHIASFATEGFSFKSCCNWESRWMPRSRSRTSCCEASVDILSELLSLWLWWWWSWYCLRREQPS